MTEPGPRLTRRRFLGTTLAGAATAAAASACAAAEPPGSGASGVAPGGTTTPGSTGATRPRPDPGARRRVVVVGAGFAGLTAALDLVEAGWEVVVLEARPRVGGRVLTLAEPFGNGLHAEAGGESIDDNHDRLLALVERFGLRTEARPVDKDLKGVVYTQGVRARTSSFVGRRGGAVARDYLRFDEALTDMAEGMDPEHPERFPNADVLDRKSLEDFLVKQQLNPDAELLVRTDNRGEYNAELADISLLFALQQAAVTRDVSDTASETKRIVGGNSRLAEAMAAALGDRLVTAAPVTRVDWDRDGVRVTSPARTVDAAHLVLAVPMPPLRAVTFSPALPESLAEVVRSLELGSAAKVSTHYTRRFWQDDDPDATGFTVTDLPFGIAWAATDSYDSASGILSQFITGTAARDAAALDDERRIHTFQAQLDQVYPEGAALRSGRAATMAWALEPFTGGGYAVYRPGQLTTMWGPLRAGIGPISFAGEQTEALAGFMESAVRSGHRVARALGPPPPG